MLTAAAGLLASPLTRYGLIALAVLGLAAGIYQSGYNAAHRQCEAAALRAELAASRQDTKAARAAELAASEAEDELRKQKSTDDAALARLAAELAKRPAAARCDLSPADARRLR